MILEELKSDLMSYDKIFIKFDILFRPYFFIDQAFLNKAFLTSKTGAVPYFCVSWKFCALVTDTVFTDKIF